VAIVLALKLMPGLSADEKRPFDVIGFIATGLTMLCLVAGLEMFSQQPVSVVSAGATLTVGVLALVWSIHHLRRAPAPLIGLSSLSVHSFRITMRGGFIFRATISAAPFMLPLMFQVGFGMSAFEAGSLVLAVFAGNLAMKPATTPLIRRFGFKKLLIGNGVVCVLSLFFCAFSARLAATADPCAAVYRRSEPFNAVYRH
jgi:Na+/melibiose symporter-like transporter